MRVMRKYIFIVISGFIFMGFCDGNMSRFNIKTKWSPQKFVNVLKAISVSFFVTSPALAGMLTFPLPAPLKNDIALLRSGGIHVFISNITLLVYLLNCAFAV